MVFVRAFDCIDDHFILLAAAVKVYCLLKYSTGIGDVTLKWTYGRSRIQLL